MTALFKGWRLGPNTAFPVCVVADARSLQPWPSLRLANHSPDGFNWGYGGSGPAQLALGILLDHTGDAKRALAHYQPFKSAFVAGWGDRWELTGEQIDAWLATREVRDERA